MARQPHGEPTAGAHPPVGYLLSQLGFHVGAMFAGVAAEAGLDPRHLGLLQVVVDHEGRSQQALGEHLGIPPGRVVALVDDLEHAGLVERRPNPTDRRAHALHATQQGRAAVADVRSRMAAFDHDLTSPLEPAERAELARLLQRLADGAGIDVHPGMRSGAPLVGGAPGRAAGGTGDVPAS